MNKFLIILSALITSVFADVKSTTGQIKFDIQSDAQAEMTLDATGLGMGISPSANLHVLGNARISQSISIGSSSGSANLFVNGTISQSTLTVSENATLNDASLVLADSSSDNITLTLPYAGNAIGRQVNIKKISPSNSVWILGGGNVIDDTSPIELPASDTLASIKIMSNGEQWYILAQKNLSDTVASENLVGWWKLDETSGNSTIDSSGQNNNGTLTNNSFSTNSQSGKLVNALYFHGDVDVGMDGNGDGDGGYITIPDSSSLDISDSITMSIWFKVDEFDHTFPTLMAKGAQNYRFYFQESTQKFRNRLDYAGATSVDLQSNATFDTDTWYHCLFTYDGTTRKLFVNGNLDASSIDVDSIVTNNDALVIGNFGEGGVRSFKGTIDDVRIYNRALTEAEVSAIYDQGL